MTILTRAFVGSALALMLLSGCSLDVNDKVDEQAAGDADTETVTQDVSTCALDGLISKSKWESLYPNRDSLYTYDALCRALRHPLFKDFAKNGSVAKNKLEVAAFLAHVSYATDELRFTRAIVQDDEFKSEEHTSE